MSGAEPESSPTLRLSAAIARLRAAGVGEVDLLETIAKAALHGPLVATGFQSITNCGRRVHSAKRLPVRRMTWRMLASPEASLKGYERMICGDDLVWNRGDHIDDFVQEAWRSVFVDRVSFEALLCDVVGTYRPRELSQEEIEGWIRDYPGSNYKMAWADFQSHFGAGACKRDERFMPAWRKVRGNPKRGQPRKSNKSVAPA